MKLDQHARQAWAEFLGNDDNHGHVERLQLTDDIDGHVEACWQSAINTVDRVAEDLPAHSPQVILEVGSSTGLNCFALKRKWPEARVLGIEPELYAVNTAQAMATNEKAPPEFSHAYGEALPLADGSVDVIICHTVIEHVNDVEAVIGEMSRVLSPHGVIHLEAPNYVWPYEPHLSIWCVPKLGKGSVRFAAKLQNKKHQIGFLDHLQFVTPGIIEQAFAQNKLAWENRVRKKLETVLEGQPAHVKAYGRAARVLHLLSRLGLSGLLKGVILRSKLYPSLLYTARKCESSSIAS